MTKTFVKSGNIESALKRFKKKFKHKVIPISCLTGEGVEELKEDLLKSFKAVSNI